MGVASYEPGLSWPLVINTTPSSLVRLAFHPQLLGPHGEFLVPHFLSALRLFLISPPYALSLILLDPLVISYIFISFSYLQDGYSQAVQLYGAEGGNRQLSCRACSYAGNANMNTVLTKLLQRDSSRNPNTHDNTLSVV